MIIKKITSKQDGLNLEIAIMECKNPKGVVQFSHGMAEHKERYFDFMRYLNDRGYVCVIHDHRGHGSSVKSKMIMDISTLKMRIILWRIYSRLRNMYVKCILD